MGGLICPLILGLTSHQPIRDKSQKNHQLTLIIFFAILIIVFPIVQLSEEIYLMKHSDPKIKPTIVDPKVKTAASSTFRIDRFSPKCEAPPTPLSASICPAPLTKKGVRHFTRSVIGPAAPLPAPDQSGRVTDVELSEKYTEELPLELFQYITELEEWALANKQDADKDIFAFWSLKLPAILASASAGIWAFFNLPLVSVIFGSLASICVMIDGIHPRGMLRNTHLRAYHDIRNLEYEIINKFRGRSPNAKTQNIVRKIIKEAEPERERIVTYVRDAETSLKDISPGK